MSSQTNTIRITLTVPKDRQKYVIDTLFQPNTNDHALYFLNSQIKDEQVTSDNIYHKIQIYNKKVCFMEHTVNVSIEYMFVDDQFTLIVIHSYASNAFLQTVLQQKISNSIGS